MLEISNKMSTIKSDILVLGAGVAGLTTALNLQKHYQKEKLLLRLKPIKKNLIPNMLKVELLRFGTTIRLKVIYKIL
jgi:thioredoxin reductase